MKKKIDWEKIALQLARAIMKAERNWPMYEVSESGVNLALKTLRRGKQKPNRTA